MIFKNYRLRDNMAFFYSAETGNTETGNTETSVEEGQETKEEETKDDDLDVDDIEVNKKDDDDILDIDDKPKYDPNNFESFTYLNSDKMNINENEQFKKTVNEYREAGFSDEQIKVIIKKETSEVSTEQIKEYLKKNLSEEEIKKYKPAVKSMLELSEKIGFDKDTIKEFTKDPRFAKFAIKLSEHLGISEKGIGSNETSFQPLREASLTYEAAKNEYTKEMVEARKGGKILSEKEVQGIVKKVSNRITNEVDRNKFVKMF